MNFFSRYQKYAPVVLRVALSIVFLWFGFSQWNNPAQWFGFLPSWTTSLGLSQATLIYLNGSFEIIFAILLLAGVFTRVVALLLTLHLLSITVSLGYGPTMIRDFGLSFALFSLFLHGPDSFCFGSREVKEL